MNYLFKRDTFLATGSVFLVIWILLYNPLNDYIFNPLKISLTDFALTDLAFSESHIKSTIDDRIVVVNLDTAGRSTIAHILGHLEAFRPKTIGLDVLLPLKKDEGNGALDAVLKKYPAIVLSQFAQYNDTSHKYTVSQNQFAGAAHRSGYVNFVGEKGGVVRYFPSFLGDNKVRFESFTTVITKLSDSDGYEKLIARNDQVEWINYTRSDSDYYVIQYRDILENRIDSSFIRNKIVLMGFVSTDPNNIYDKHFTPLNKKVLGRSVPDMNGVLIHANILSMILDRDYIIRVPGWMTIFIAVLLTWFHIAFLIRYYINKQIWFHLVVKVAELVIGAILFYISILLLRYVNVNIDFTWALIAIIIAVDVLYFYDSLANWLSRKFSYQSIFSQTQRH